MRAPLFLTQLFTSLSRQVAMATFITKHITSLKPVVPSRSRTLTLPQSKPMVKPPPATTSLNYQLGNAEQTLLPPRSFDLVTVMWAFHEAPRTGRARILREARRLLAPGGTLAVVDISTEYVPSPTMLSGEPYLQEYQTNIRHQLSSCPGFDRHEYKEIVPSHLGMWILKRSAFA